MPDLRPPSISPRVYWPATRPDKGSDDPVPLPGRVDVAVVGAGFAGLSVAADLLDAAPGLRVAVLDAHHTGHGASGRNAGGLLPLTVLPWLLPGRAAGHDHRDLQRQMHARIGRTATRLAAEYPSAQIRPGQMLLTATGTGLGEVVAGRVLAAGLATVADAVEAAGIPVGRHDGAAVTAMCGGPATAGIALAAWTIQPAALAEALTAAVVTAGGLVLEHTPVAAVRPGPGGVVVGLRNGRELVAGHAVVCTGAWTDGVALPDPPRARVLHTYMRAGRPQAQPADLGRPDLFVASPGPGMVYRRMHAGRVLFGGLDVAGLTPGPAADALPRAHAAVDRLLRRHLPAAAGPAEHRWGGPIHVTRTEVPHLAASAVSDRIVYALGFAGSGVALSLSAGPLVRDLVLGSAAADEEAVVLRQAMQATRIPWRGAATTLRRLVHALVTSR